MTNEELKNILLEGPCKVVFEKADGSVREMLCTINKEYINYETAGVSKPNPNVITVWDIDKQSWRSFRIDKLISFPERVKL